MERPVPRTRIGRRLEPPAWREDVVALVAVDVARADAVAVRAIAHDVGTQALSLTSYQAWPVPFSCARISCALPSLSRSTRSANSMLKPSWIVATFQVYSSCLGSRGLPRIAPPRHFLREPGDRHDIRIVVRVDIDHEVAEVVDVLVAEAELAEAVLRPRRPIRRAQGRRLVPVLARDDVEAPVAVDVGHRGRLARTRVDRREF